MGGTGDSLAVHPCDILVGSRGWDHPAWSGDFYPEDLPEDWRLSFYANVFRAVLVPWQVLAETEDPAQWLHDVPPGFRFYAQVGEALLQRLGGEPGLLEQRLALLEPQLAALVLTEAPAPGSAAEAWIQAPEQDRPTLLCAPQPAPDSPPEPCWRPGAETHGGRGGCFGLLRAEAPDPRGLRASVESFMAWSRGCSEAMLCFEPTPHAPERMQEARIMAELLGG